MKVKVIKKFLDKEEKKNRKVGEIFETSEKRFKEINSTSWGILVEKTSKKLSKEK